MTKSFLFFCAAVLSIAPSSSGQQTSKKDKGFYPLFDGKSTKGWHAFNKQQVGSGWKVADGALYLDPTVKDGGDLVTDEVFDNFHLKLEWKISKGGNSGIMFYVQEGAQYSAPWKTGPEMQVIDNDNHADAKIHKHRAGDLYDLVACSTETVKPLGEWNLAEIISNKGNLTLRLNGTTVVETKYGGATWHEMIAGSKFKSMPDFGGFDAGKISLQDHGNEVWFRNIVIKKL